MKTSSLLVVTLALFTVWGAFGQDIQATTDDGRRVLLKKDGSWTFIEQIGQLPAANSKSYSRPEKSSAVLKLEDGRFAIWYDPEKWKPQPSDIKNRVLVMHRDGDAGVQIIAERFPMSMANYREVVIANARKFDPDMRITYEDDRLVNGLSVHCMKIQGTFRGVPVGYYGYYYTGNQGAIQLVSFAPSNLYDRYEPDFEDFLDGLTVSTTGELAVAILAPLSGPVPTFGVSTRNGALMAIDEWNARGGVLGMKITPVVEDSQCTPDAAVNAAKRVISQDGVRYIIGEVCSKASIPVSLIANSSRVIQISPTSTNPQLTVGADGAVKPYIFRACFIDPYQGTVGAVFAFSTLKATKAFIMADDGNAYVKSLADAFEATFIALGGKIVGRKSHTGTETDFSASLAEIDTQKPDVVYLPDYYTIVNLVTRQARAKGIAATFLGGDGWDSHDLDVEAADGSYFVNHYSPDDTRSEVRSFLKAYGNRYKDESGRPSVPDALAALAYDTTNLLLQAIQSSGQDDTDKVKTALEKISFSAVTGNTTFDPLHNPVKGAVIMRIRGGRVQFDSYFDPVRLKDLPSSTPPGTRRLTKSEG